MNKILTICTLSCLLILPGGTANAITDEEAKQLGLRIVAVQQALNHPAEPQSMQAVLDLGRDSRYYLMMRGWLSQQLQADRSILQQYRNNPAPGLIVERAHFVQRAIRMIDLE
ncbi:MAG: hypothetical protein KZQ58_05720 [gamma proteobacterium symbiont of Bathyaustriella thionipta]|nr:hypothetical protein [gamma proteobacterium symbiont of Bathyaustriella thionipta]